MLYFIIMIKLDIIVVRLDIEFIMLISKGGDISLGDVYTISNYT